MAGFAIFLFYLFLLPHHRVTSEEPSFMFTDPEKQALLSFITNVRHTKDYSWDKDKAVCIDDNWEKNWKGVRCGAAGVMHLKIPGALSGVIPKDTIGKLSSLHYLSLHRNKLSGSIPSDFSNLGELTGLYLDENLFTGELQPEMIGKLVNLKFLYINNNFLTGPIPREISQLTKLTELSLHHNRFTGEIPPETIGNLVNLEYLYINDNQLTGYIPSDFSNLVNLKSLDFSNNNFEGQIPEWLAKFGESNFSGNPKLCGHPLRTPCKPGSTPPPAPPRPHAADQTEEKPHEKKTKRKYVIVGVSVGTMLLLLTLCCLRKKFKQSEKRASQTEMRHKLVFLDGSDRFDLEDLYEASPEVLGKGSVGTSYKVVMDDGGTTTTVVVKRLKDVEVTKDDFVSTMETLGKMKDEHLLPLRAYYYSNDDVKLLVHDYLPAGSLSATLHGSRGSGRTSLAWDDRVRIALSAAKGVAYLHTAGIVHGNIKSSNILLQQDTNKDALVSDFGLNTLFGVSSYKDTGYLAPEVLYDKTLTLTSESDVYSFGVLLLELLTGKEPKEGADLPRWVKGETSVHKVFDDELMRYQNQNIEKKMVGLLQIAMECVSSVRDQRPSMDQVVKKMEDMKEVEADGGFKIAVV